jgi:putative ABC transport system substrate-binding protein
MSNLDAMTENDFAPVFAMSAATGRQRPTLIDRRDRIVGMAAQHAIPVVYFTREFGDAGGLMSYGASIGEGYHRAGLLTTRILKGEKPGDLPVQRLTKYEFVINLKTAKALGLTIPPSLLARADEVIE